MCPLSPTGSIANRPGRLRVAGERRGRVSFASSEIQSMDGKILADAELVLMDIPESQFTDVDLEAMGWRVYLDEEVG